MEHSNADSRRAERVIPASRRRDKPQLSCNLCRRRKLKCDRNSPCESCVRRGLSLSCAYPVRNLELDASNVASQRKQADITDRISQLERLVVTLMNSRNDIGQANVLPESSTAVPPDAPEDTGSQVADAVGRIVLDKSTSSYVENIHWSAILDGMAELKDSLTNDQEEKNHFHEIPQISDAHRPAILFGSYRSATREELLASLPPRQVVDQLVAYFFQHDLIATAIIHGPMFMKEYGQFWKHPFQTSIIWVGQLFAIISLASCHRDRHVPGGPNLLRYEQTYCERIVQCLVLGNYSSGPQYTLETFILYLDIKYQHYEANRIETWFVLGLIVRLALRMGYHRDPSHFPQIAPYEAEMRRRTWAYIVLYDILMSGHVGLPRMIHEGQADTAEPLNVFDEDFDSASTTLPPAKPDTFISPAIFLVSKKRVAAVYGMICDLTTSSTNSTPTYDQIQRLHTLLDEAYASIPATLRSKTTSVSPTDTPQLILRRIFLSTLLHTAKCILHKKHMVLGRTDHRYATSQLICLDAAIEGLCTQKFLYNELQVGGSLYGFIWKIPSLLNSGFYLATTLLCLFVKLSIDGEASSGKTVMSENVQRDRAIQALYDAYMIWTQSSPISSESRTVVETVLDVLQRAKRMGISATLLEMVTSDETPFPDNMNEKLPISFQDPDAAISSFMQPDRSFLPQEFYYGGQQDHLNEQPLFNAMEPQIEDLLSMSNSEHFQDVFGPMDGTQNDFLGL